MANPIVTRIDQAAKESWPVVASGIARTMRSLQELSEISGEVMPRVEEYVARSEGSVRRRKVAEETIWVLASLGWLRTGPERDVVLAAKAYADAVADPDASDDELVQLEDQLTDTVKSLPEYMTAPKES